ncbi:uncharacterized protein CC84DRAFT_1112890 [Paraphaeosphaeria sporulosa]|uniref:Arb2 domain-containing protein n=1 Tax=Paraphaeosphaeria sporulosa TaxID=1460663 RepID=A0A177CUF0_9PLEO|nr:uncharacterized protein CC84DRAFT_1112890 [Paraphaeosphaeria sporulosa]OAG10510.1 hypothetical protein CC84DRAFT_1112890 [Paraphaeosphaeria sporulosa]
MFRRQESTLDPDAQYPADLKKLGYFVDKNGCFRRIDAPELFFDFFYTNNDRHNEVRGEAMRVCQRREVMSRLSALGLKELYLPTLSNNKPKGPHIPILAPVASVLKTRKRVIVIINDDTYQDLGVLAYRELQREGGVNGGSVINFTKGLVNRAQANMNVPLGEKLAKDGARIEKEKHIPGLIVFNAGQLLYSHKLNQALSNRSWTALARKSITHDPVKIHEIENRVEGHRTAAEHIKTVFDTVIKNPNFVSPEAEVYVIAIENGVESLLEVLDKDFYRYADRITALAAMQSPVGAHQIHNPDVKTFLLTRARHWETSQHTSGDPAQCKASSSDYISKAISNKSTSTKPIDWLETVERGSGHRADTPFANIREAKVTIAVTEEPASDDGFIDATPLCPTFGGGNTWVGECVFTQSIVQEAVLGFFEEVARDPKGYYNPNFTLDPPLSNVDSRFDPIPDEMLNPEKKELLAAQEELRQLEVAFNAVPEDNPDLRPGHQRLHRRIIMKHRALRELEEKVLAAGALGLGDAKDVRDKWSVPTDGVEWKEMKRGAPIPFAGVQADSNMVASAGCLGRVEEELAKLELEEDEE